MHYLKNSAKIKKDTLLKDVPNACVFKDAQDLFNRGHFVDAMRQPSAKSSRINMNFLSKLFLSKTVIFNNAF